MPWPIAMVESPDVARARWGYVPVGAMWFAELPDGATLDQWCEWYAPAVGRRYLREHRAQRRPLFVKLPDGTHFCVDFCSSREIGTGGGEGWGYEGVAPRITLSPSINIVGSYHGYIRDGVITDDCEGRTYPHAQGFPSPSSRNRPMEEQTTAPESTAHETTIAEDFGPAATEPIAAPLEENKGEQAAAEKASETIEDGIPVGTELVKGKRGSWTVKVPGQPAVVGKPLAEALAAAGLA